MAIRTIPDLHRHLQWAIEIEHGTLPPYLTALYSIKQGHNRDAAEVIASVFMEEMLHLTMAANVLNAVGGSPRLDAPGVLPAYPAHLPHSSRAFEIPLGRLSPEAIEVFLKIERPSEHQGQPEDDSYETVGQFYEAVELGLRGLCEELGEDQVFTGDPARQINDRLHYRGAGTIVEVSDLASATEALAEIVEQGEGLQHQQVWDGDQAMHHPDRPEVAHFFRFEEIRLGRRYQRGDTPQSGPSGELLHTDWDAVHNMRPNPRSAEYPEGSEARRRLDQFNRSYSAVLHLLDEAFNGSPALLAVATGQMYGLKQEAIALMELPTGDRKTTVGPSFEYVAPGLRHRRAAGEQRIVVVADGPYLVYGEVPLARKRRVVSENGKALTWEKREVLETEETYALCRCGRSEAKPFCDGTHAELGFDGTETAESGATAERQRILGGTGIIVRRDHSLCMHAGFCKGRTRGIAEMIDDTDDSDVRSQVVAMIERCPSGSYVYGLEDSGDEIEPDLPVGIAVVEDPDSLASCLWVTGGIPIERADGEPLETRNRLTLCRCGQSSIKPLCDGTHKEIGFRE